MKQFLKFAYSAQGSNHIRDGKVCQDASAAYEDEQMSIVAVADGHGSDNYPRTDRGSKFAVEAAQYAIEEFVKAVHQDEIDVFAEQETRMHDLELNILGRWHECVEDDLSAHPFEETELVKVSEKYRKVYQSEKERSRWKKAYGTTLIAVCATADYWFGLQIGDGKCFAITEDSECTEPIPWDENCQANITTSICDSDAIDEFRFFCVRKFPLAVFIGSDGVDDSYAGEEELLDLYRTIFCVFAEKGPVIGTNEIKDFLPTMSQKGSGDDVSMAGLIRSGIQPEIIGLVRCRQEYNAAHREVRRLERELAVVREKRDALRNIAPDESIAERRRQFEAEYEGLLSTQQKAEKVLKDAKHRLETAIALFRQAEEREMIPQKRLPSADNRRRKKKRPKRSGKKMNWSKRHKKRRKK